MQGFARWLQGVACLDRRYAYCWADGLCLKTGPRTSNPIESTFDPVRLRTRATRRMRKVQTGLYLVFQLIRRAERRWRRIDAPHLVAKVLEGALFVDGVEVLESATKRKGAA